MKIAILGGAGIQALGIVTDLLAFEPNCRILLVDLQMEALLARAARFADPRVSVAVGDLSDEAATVRLIADSDVVVMSGPLGLCLPAARAALTAEKNYIDLGTFPEETSQQMVLGDAFAAIRRSAILGVGSAPGITSVMVRACADRLDTMSDVDITIAMRDLTERGGRIRWPFTADAILDEHTMPARAFIDGALVDLPPRMGRKETFAEPIGTVTAYCTNHPEPTTISASFAKMGVRNVVFRIALPDDVDHAVAIMAALGLAQRKSLKVQGADVELRRVVMAALMDVPQHLAVEERQWSATRVTARGMKGGRTFEHIADMVVPPHAAWNLPAGLVKTAIPPAIVAAMMGHGVPMPVGVHVPETAVEPEPFFAALAKRGLEVRFSSVEVLGGGRL